MAAAEHIGIASALEVAIQSIDKEAAEIPHQGGTGASLGSHILDQTNAHAHNIAKRVFVFTDDVLALRYLEGSITCKVGGYIAEQAERVCSLSQTIHEQGVHQSSGDKEERCHTILRNEQMDTCAFLSDFA
ncbi:uncharacterized protein N7529_010799 [Penicillium soppii]|uniref:uncharacterized protein n=1 Tax=Penicillium soppii TaxID=69789 RepID=UPI0025489475|nr:uncharacterized protein N7529_010799 [Penicillium soppii]KAJ5851414.1 hypothetical protein N7529_010799 [Penicillium soppii]